MLTSYFVCQYHHLISLFFHQACAGLLADARAIVDVARIEASNYRAEYGMPIPCMVSVFNCQNLFARQMEIIEIRFGRREDMMEVANDKRIWKLDR